MFKIGIKNKQFINRYGFFLFLGTTVLTFLIFVVNLLRCNIDTDWLSWIFYIIAALGHASLFALILYILLYIPFSFIFKSYIAPAAIFVTFAIALQAILILNGFVFNLYRFHINGFVIELLLSAGRENFLIGAKQYLMFGLLIVFTVILPYILMLWSGKRWSVKRRKKQIVTVSIILIMCILFSHVAHAVASATRQISIQKSATVLPFFFPLTMNRLLYQIGIAKPDDLDRLDYDVPASDIAYPINPIITKDSISGYNILLIVIDSWNPRSFDSITTPNMYRMASKYQNFSNHSSSSDGTRGSIFGIFFGLSFTYQIDFTISRKSPILVDMLVKHDYAIQLFPSSSLPTNPPFREVLFRKVPNINTRIEENIPIERDKKITQLAIEHINEWKNRKPFFAFVFYVLPHGMSIPKEYLKFEPTWTETNYMTLNNNTDPEPFFNLYRSCVYQVDKQVGILLEHVQNSGLMDNTIIIITGDHGQEFNENRKNYWGHNSNFSRWQLQVPFIMYYPGVDTGKHFSHLTTHYDIAPTLLKRHLGVENPSGDYSMGYDIYDTTCRLPHVVGDHVNYGFVMKNTIVRTDHLGRMMVTDSQMNELPRNAVNVKELQQAIEKKNMFYKK